MFFPPCTQSFLVVFYLRKNKTSALEIISGKIPVPNVRLLRSVTFLSRRSFFSCFMSQKDKRQGFQGHFQKTSSTRVIILTHCEVISAWQPLFLQMFYAVEVNSKMQFVTSICTQLLYAIVVSITITCTRIPQLLLHVPNDLTIVVACANS